MLKGDKILSSTQCQVLRGIAIMGIFLHNFCHLLPGSNEENEFEFIAERANNMWNYWTGGNIDVFAPIQLFAFFGHYGVPIFLFLSGYGLVMKYERDGASSQVGAWQFLGSHWLKLFKLMILGFVLTVITYLACGLSWRGWIEYIAQATMLSNIIPGLSQCGICQVARVLPGTVGQHFDIAFEAAWRALVNDFRCPYHRTNAYLCICA